jgi:SAM-dependent methyltransferase
MTMPRPRDDWASGDAYEPFVGRWSRLVGRAFIDWLAEPPELCWIDVGCGTGILSEMILEHGLAGRIVGVDSSEAFIAHARRKEMDRRVSFRRAASEQLPFGAGEFDVAASGLVLNFLPDPAKGVAEMRRTVKPGGTVAAYVWDYAEGMQMLRAFWDAAAALDPAARDLDESRRFPLARPEPLAALFEAAGLEDVETRAIDVPTVFEDFEDFWTPFLGGVGPAPGYCLSLDKDRRAALAARLRETLPRATDDSIHLEARAWAVRGTVPG